MYNGTMEKNINLSIAQKLENILIKKGAIVYMTRIGDYDLSVTHAYKRKRSDLFQRARMINKSDCDIFISIHLNADSTSTWYGAQAFYDDINKENEKIAKIMQEEFKNNLKSNRKYKKIDTVFMLKNTTRPGVLMEVGFLSNNNERYLLKQDDYQIKISNTITSGIIRYFN